MTNGQHIARSRHLEEFANAAKHYTLREILDVTEAVAAELENISISGGISGGGGSSTDLILPTVPATVDGGFWYELTDNVPMLWLRQGNYSYGFNYDKAKFMGTLDDALAAYLKFDGSTTADICGNEWTASGSPTIQDGALYLNGSSYLINSNVASDIGVNPWTIDFWATVTTHSAYGGFFGTFNALYSGSTNQWVCVMWNSGNPMLNFFNNYPSVNLGLSLNTRHHYALVYDGTNVRFFVDGVLGKTVTLPVQLGGEFIIGARSVKDYPVTGTIDHFRVFNGVALWTENFTPPTESDYA